MNDNFQQMRFGERIKALRGYLPEFMVKNSNVYGVLSRGVHELSEEECLLNFPIVLGAINLILEERYSEKQRALREQEIERGIAALATSAGKTSDA